MDNKIQRLLLLGCALFSMGSAAGSDPVAWQMSPSTGFPETAVGSQSTVTYTFTSRLPGPASLVMQPTTQGSGFSVHNLCNNFVLQNGQSCNVIVRFTPTQAGTSTFQLTYGYNNDRIPLPTLSAKATGSPAPTYSLTGSFTSPNPFPATFHILQSPFVVAEFINTGNTALTGCRAGNNLGNNQLTINPAPAATVTANTPQAGTCGTVGTPISIQPNGRCYLYGQLSNLAVNNGVTLGGLVTCTEATGTAQSPAFDIVSSNPPCTTVAVHNELQLPANTYKYADNVVKFKITNTCASDNVDLGTVTVTSNIAATITTPVIYDHCSSQQLTPGQSCYVTSSVIPQATGALTVTAAVTPVGGSNTTVTTSSTVASNIQPTHHILFVNQCDFDVWYGMGNGTGANCPGPNCLSPDPNSGALPSAYHLPKQVPGQTPNTIDLAVAGYQNGAFWPRTGCTMTTDGQFNCATGNCATVANSGSCKSTGGLVQPQSPYTKFEANLNPTPGNDGVYDVSTINGMTVPVEVKAFGPTVGNTASTVYTCSGAGALIQPPATSNLGNCTWTYDPSSTMPGGAAANHDFYWVTIGADDGCNANAGDQLCGMAWSGGPVPGDPTGKTPINRRLGSFLGYNTLDVYAAYTTQDTNNGVWGSVNLFTKYGLDIEIPNQTPMSNYGSITNQVIFPHNTYLSYYVLLSCPVISSTSALNSCYQSTTNNDFTKCCGCVEWGNTMPQHACGYQSQGQYTADMNNDWTGDSGPIQAPAGDYTPQNAVEWIKNACPTAYAYTYDDPSSSFTCTQDNGTNLYTSYQVTFCPGGISGLPTGYADGRSTPPQ